MISNKKVPRLRFKEFSGEWEENSLTNFCDILNGLTYKPKNVEDAYKANTFVIRSSNIKNGIIIDSKDNVYVNNDCVNVANVQEKDILVVVRNGSKNLIGKHAIVKRKMPNTVVGAFMSLLRCNNGYFLNSLLDSENFKIEIFKSLGATINQITKKDFKLMRFNFPLSTEQEKIGNFFTKLDRLIELQTKKVEQLKQLKRGYLQKIFPQKGETVPRLRFAGFSGEWEEKKLNDFSKIIMGQSPHSQNYTSNSIDKILVQGNADMANGIVYPRVYTKEITKVSKINEVILTVRAPVGELAINNYDEVVIGRGVASLSSNNNKFLYYYLNNLKMNHYWDRLSAGSTFQSISSDDIRNAIILIPSDKEQSKIVSFLNKIFENISNQEKKLSQLKDMKKGYLQKMFC
ncbi:restriction endonuclease subunit S [Apilactobacillus xinyiensis]|uniref:restriction endonuclease subunit S n=1 Tax=Apilactobacillus xinyiensis TaxID=2841032 RepID=UPI001C7D0DD8|nr:restriction endonuclease subunit S [Apilactobacillus xinyiensis]